MTKFRSRTKIIKRTVKQYTNRSTELGPQTPRYHKISPSSGHHAIRRNSGHRKSGQHRRQTTQEYNQKSCCCTRASHYPRHTDEQDYSENVLNCWQVDAHESAQVGARGVFVLFVFVVLDVRLVAHWVVQGGFAKMSRKWQKMAKNDLKKVEFGFLDPKRPEIACFGPKTA